MLATWVKTLYTVNSPLKAHLYNSHLLGGQPKHLLLIKPFYNSYLSTMATSSVAKVAIKGRFNYSEKFKNINN